MHSDQKRLGAHNAAPSLNHLVSIANGSDFRRSYPVCALVEPFPCVNHAHKCIENHNRLPTYNPVSAARIAQIIKQRDRSLGRIQNLAMRI